MKSPLIVSFIICLTCCTTNSHYERLKADRYNSYLQNEWSPMSESPWLTKMEREYKVCQAVADCSQLIHDVVKENWKVIGKRDRVFKSAFEIHLNDNFEVIDIKLKNRSGDFLLDRLSAKAIKTSSPFLELKSLSQRDFDENFKKFIMVFTTLEN